MPQALLFDDTEEQRGFATNFAMSKRAITVDLTAGQDVSQRPFLRG